MTDFVAVLSSRYINANTDFKGRAPSAGEMARFVDRVVKTDPAERVRVFLAPVEKPAWDLWRVRDFWLSDTRSNSWLIRLRHDRFTWRAEKAGESADQIADAVTLIICDKPRTG